ncbi:DUF397 domain-containing protein [Streptomyces sp. NPDC051173]|uniref:DUF397 domain-containing protein n=1 Tax=Streptomyces sp. NPDC051173 TaxID=3155164 RepID=UPI00344B29A2
MSRTEFSKAIWRKSSYSSGNGQCVEIAVLREVVATRDSKNSHGPALVLGVDAWSAFVSGVKAGDFLAVDQPDRYQLQ